MTKAQAIEKVIKLLALAENPNVNPNEKTNAEQQAKRIMKEHKLTGSDLRSASKVAAFDQIVDMARDYADKHPGLNRPEANVFGSAKFITDIIGSSKAKLDSSQKAALLDKIKGGLHVAALIFGNNNQTVNELRAIIESALKSNNLQT